MAARTDRAGHPHARCPFGRGSLVAGAHDGRR